ncbi:MAG: TadE/TadG family type IV pilus assembly protein [Erythrobacter sp.]
MRPAQKGWQGIQRCNRGIAALEFALLAPALLMLGFAVIVYSIYFAAMMGVRQAASEGARAAMAGLNTVERVDLAQTRATSVLDRYGSIIGNNPAPEITAAPISTGVFEVRVRYNIAAHPIMQVGFFIPLPDPQLEATVVVTNGSY